MLGIVCLLKRKKDRERERETKRSFNEVVK